MAPQQAIRPLPQNLNLQILHLATAILSSAIEDMEILPRLLPTTLPSSELAMPLPGIAQPTDLAEAAALQARLNRFMDAILLGVIAGYEGSEP